MPPSQSATPSPPESSGEFLLALDQGGSSSRAIAFDASGLQVASASVRVGEHRESEDRVEQDPDELVESLRSAAERCVREIVDARVAAGVRGVAAARPIAAAGLATQRSSVVCWDRVTGEALSPVLSWQDRRAAEELSAFARHAKAIHWETGLFLSPHYGASKLRWCLDHIASVRTAQARGRLAMGPLASFLAFRLLSESLLESALEGRPFVADPANASRTLLWSIRSRDFAPGLLDLFGIPRDVLPACVPSRGEIGMLEIDGEMIPLRVLTGDQSAAVFASGTPRADTAYVNIGTGAFVQRPCEAIPADLPRLLASLAHDDGERATFVVEGTINGAGSAVRAIAEELGLGEIEGELGSMLARSTNPPLFLNGVSGLAAPFWVPDFESRFVGRGDPHEEIAAVLESVLFLVRAILEEMSGPLPRPSRIRISGGLARIDGLCARLAALTKIPVERPPESEATARGLAWLVAGSNEAWPERGRSSRFPALEDPMLDTRYHRWRGEMDRAIVQRRVRR
jgi:glycerol kinase